MKDYIQQKPRISHVFDGHTRASKQPPVNQIIQSYSSNIIQCTPAEDEQLNDEIAGIINMLEGLLNSEICISNPETFEEVTNYIIKSKEIMDGNDIQAKEALIESSKNGTPSTTKDEGTTISNSSSSQMKVSESHPIQRVGGLVIGGGILAAGLIGYGIYRLLHRHVPPADIQEIPTRREDYGQRPRLGGLYRNELSNEEIGEEVRRITSENHQLLYQRLQQELEVGNITRDIAELVQGVRDDAGLAPGGLCHDLTRYIVDQRIHRRPTINELQDVAGGQEIEYDLNGGEPLDGLLAGQQPGTSVYLGSVDSLWGHSFTIIGEIDGHVIVADRHPTNPIASLKYASAVEAEARLARNLHPDQEDDIDREFSGRFILHNFQ